MVQSLHNTHPRRLVLLTSALAPLAVFWGAHWQGTGGAVTFASLLLPIVMVSVSARTRWVFAALAIGATGVLAEAILSGGPDGGTGGRFAVALVMELIILSGFVTTLARCLRGAVDEPGHHTAGDADQPSPAHSGPKLGDQAAAAASAEEKQDVDAVRFPELLETLEDIGRFVSMNLDLDTLVPAIVSTAITSLSCRTCEVYLWDATGRTLFNPLSPEEQKPSDYVPHAEHGIGAWVIRQRLIWTRERALNDTNFQAEADFNGPLPDAVAPLTAGGDLLGLIVVSHLEQLSPDLERMLSTLANIYGLGIKNALLFRRVEEMARRDGLTGLYNHATFQQELHSLVQQAVAEGAPLSLVMSDVDFFKNVNDDFGHQAGDDVLRELARLWKAALPDSAVIARYGGEEFIAALPGIDEHQSSELAEFLRQSIAEHPFLSNGAQLSVTASFGVAELGDGTQRTDDLVRVADQCLYAAKNAGRNRVTSRSTAAALSLESDCKGGHFIR